MQLEIGNVLKQKRLENNYSLEDIEKITKIRMKYIKALEDEEFDLLPGSVYVVAFIRNYAKFLGLDDNELIQRYKELYPDIVTKQNAAKTGTENNENNKNKKVTKKTVKKSFRKSRYIFYLVPVIVLGFFIALALAYKISGPWFDAAKPPGVPQDNQQQEQPQPPSGTDTGQLQTVPNPDLVINNEKMVELVLNVVDDRCWIKIEVDGEVKFTGIAHAGETKKFTGAEYIYIELGNAGVVEVQVDGEKLGFLAPRGAVVKKEFTN